MRHNADLDRTVSLRRLIPNLFSGIYKSVLYIGAGQRFDYGIDFKNAGMDITVLEISNYNITHWVRKIPWIKNIIEGDARTFTPTEHYDVVFWWHGPEHIKKEEFIPTMKKIESYGKVIILGCPWGKFDLGPLKENVHEAHISEYDHSDFESLGYEVECLGEKDVPGSNLAGVKYVNLP